MLKPFTRTRKTNTFLAQRVIEAVLKFFAIYIIPVAIGIVSVIALAFWHDHYVASGEQPLDIRVLASSAKLTPAQAMQGLAQRAPVDYHETQLSEIPVWMAFSVAGKDADEIEFPSRHIVDIACWDAGTLRPLGQASRDGTTMALSAMKSGFVLRLPNNVAQVLCRASSVGPARLTAVAWQHEQLELSVQRFHRKSGLLDGGMIVLTLFVLITALINRQVLYVQFAGWLLLNLRIGALSAGWDVQWLGQAVPSNWLLPLRAVTIALYAVSSLTLYQTLFGASLADTRFRPLLRFSQWVCLPFLASALMLPYRYFLPMMWCVVAFGLSLMTLGLVTIMLRSRNRVAVWFAASFAVTFMAGLAEVIAAALGTREVVGIVNSVTAALTSSLLAALAVAEQMRIETEQRLEAQDKLQQAYEAMPVGLFTLDMYGHFLSANPALRKMLGAETIVAGRTGWKQFFAENLWVELHEQVHLQSEAEMQVASRDGSQRFMISATLARGRIEAVLQDVTEKHRATEQLRFMANNDPLTKVFNRRGVEKMFEAAVQSLGAGKPMSLAYIDLDRFKLINDLFGHAAGDEVLKQVCERIELMLAGASAASAATNSWS
jgi:PAS domain S-box-containing protein